MKRKALNPAMALATHFGWDIADMREHRYQSTRTPCPVFSLDDGYYTATPLGVTPKTSSDYPEWEPVKSWMTDAYGNLIWKLKDAST